MANFSSGQKYLDKYGLSLFWDKVRQYIQNQIGGIDGTDVKLYPSGENNPTVTDQIEKLWNSIGSGEANVQSDWNETDTNSDAYIKNKPTIPTNTSQLTNNNQTFIGRTDGIISNTDADNFTDSGAYLFQTGNGDNNTNFPITGYGILNVFNSPYSNLTTNYIGQLLLGSYSIFYRTKVDTWSDWKRIALTSDIPTKLSQLTDDVVDGKYLPITGGIINTAATTPLNIKNTQSDPTEVGIRFMYNNDSKGWIGYNTQSGTTLYTYNGAHKLGVKDDGIAYVDSNTLIHSGNIKDQYVAGVYDSYNPLMKITFNYAGDAITSNPTWLACWNGYTLSYVSPDNVKAGKADHATVFGSNDFKVYAENSNEINFGGTAAKTNVYFGYRDKDGIAVPQNYYFGSSGGANVRAGAFCKKDSSNSYVLLGGGAHKSLSDFSKASWSTFTPAETALTNDDVLSTTGEFSLAKGSWYYAGNGYLPAGEFGNIDLAGCSVLTFGGNSGGAYTQLFITSPAPMGSNAVKANEILFYNNHGEGYSPGWTRVLTNRNYTDYINTTSYPGINKTGTVTSVGLSMPTGFSVSSSPITSSGTLSVSFASGYSLPTTAKQDNWDTAYGWGNHASAGYKKTDTNYYHTRSYSSGLQISTGTGVSNMYVPYATASQAGVVSTGSQTFAGAKTFNSTVKASAFYIDSDERLKTFGEDIKVDFDELAKLRKSHFVFNNNPTKQEIGVSAQEVQKLYPEIVNETEEGTLSVDYSKLAVVALAAIDKLNQRVQELENKLAKYE